MEVEPSISRGDRCYRLEPQVRLWLFGAGAEIGMIECQPDVAERCFVDGGDTQSEGIPNSREVIFTKGQCMSFSTHQSVNATQNDEGYHRVTKKNDLDESITVNSGDSMCSYAHITMAIGP